MAHWLCLKADLVSIGEHRGSRHGEQQELVQTDQTSCVFGQLVLLGCAETPAQLSLLRMKSVHVLDAMNTCSIQLK